MASLKNVPGNNAMGGPAASAVSTPAKGSVSIFGALSSALRSAQGKRPVSDVRDTVKMLLRVYSSQDWAKLPEVQLASVKAYEASMSADEAEPLTHIYRSILEIFGSSLSTLLMIDLSVVFPRTIEELDGLKQLFASNARSAKAIPASLKSLLRSYTKVKERSAQNIKDYEKIVNLVTQAEAGIAAFYDSKAQQVNAAKTFIREAVRADAAAARTAASVAAAASRKATRNTATAASAAAATARKTQRALNRLAPKSAHEITNAEVEAEMAKLQAEVENNKGKAAWAAITRAAPGGKRTRKGRSNRKSSKSRKN